MTTQKPERKDWALFIYIIPIAVLLLFFVGQWAIKLLPFWSVNAGMNSNLEPDSGAAHPFALLEPLLPQILIPLPWAETYLDPNGDFSFPPFLTFEPTASPAPTAVEATQTESTPTATAVPTETPTATSIVGTSPTNAGGGGEETPTETSTSPATCNDSAATNNGGPLPCTFPPTPPTTCQNPAATNYLVSLPCVFPPTPPTTCQDPAATNYLVSLPCVFPPTPPTTCQDPAATNYLVSLPCVFPPTPPVCPGAHNPDGPLPCDYGNVSTPDPSLTMITPPAQAGTGVPDNSDPLDDSKIAYIWQGNYFVIVGLSVTVSATPDNNYDLVLYEFNNNGTVNLDWIIIGLSKFNDGSQYYEVFTWGDGVPDVNTNVGDVAQAAGAENDNHPIQVADPTDVSPVETELYDPDYDSVNGTNGPAPQTGILIDVDENTSGNPPPGDYDYIVIISPNWVGSADPETQVDSIQATEVPIP